MKKILVHIYHTASELDVLLPIFMELAKTRDISVTLVFSEKHIYEKYLEDSISRECVKRLGIRVVPTIALQWASKIPGRDKPVSRFAYRMTKYVEHLLYLPFLAYLVSTHDVYMHEFTKFTDKTYLFYLATSIGGRRKRIFAYPHATALHYHTTYRKTNVAPQHATLLAFDSKSGRNYRKLGYENQHIIGFPKFFPSWIKYLASMDSGYPRKSYIVIYSRSIHHIYMDADTYRYLYESAYRAIRTKFGNIKIVVKLHPREDKTLFASIMKSNGMDNVELSSIHPGVLAKDSLLTISFYTSAILDSLAFDVPSVEYYRESKRLRESEPEGSIYKLMGIDSVDSEDRLKGFFDRVIAGTHVRPTFMDSFINRGHVDVDFL